MEPSIQISMFPQNKLFPSSGQKLAKLLKQQVIQKYGERKQVMDDRSNLAHFWTRGDLIAMVSKQRDIYTLTSISPTKTAGSRHNTSELYLEEDLFESQ
jgi:hypothetical protein